MTDLKQLNEALDSALQTNQAMGKKLQQQAALIDMLVDILGHHHKFGLKIHDKKYIGSDTYNDTIKALQSAKEAGYL